MQLGNLTKTKVGKKVDRASALGNPFYLDDVNDEEGRRSVCLGYYFYFDKVVVGGMEPLDAAMEVVRGNLQLNLKLATDWAKKLSISSQWNGPTRNAFMDELEELTADDTILCWCHPKACHGEVIAKHVDSSFQFTESFSSYLSSIM